MGEVWGANTLGKIASPQQFSSEFFSIITFAEKLHLKFCKRILGVYTKASNVAVYAELGRAPLLNHKNCNNGFKVLGTHK